MRPTNAQRAVEEDSPVELHTSSGVLSATKFNKCIVLFTVNLYCEDRVTGTLAESHLTHLGIEEECYVILIGKACDAAKIKATGLTSKVGVWDQTCWDRRMGTETDNLWSMATVSTRKVEKT